MNRIVVVDDEKPITDSIEFALKKEGYSVEVFHDGLSALNRIRSRPPSLVVLDIMMPRMDGLEMCRRMRLEEIQAPIIFLSSRDDEIDRIMGLEMGGDDYLSKPFSIRELLARIRAVLKRSGHTYAPADRTVFRHGNITLDADRAVLSINGSCDRLTLTELRILSTLMENPDVILSRAQLMQSAFPEDVYPNPRATDSHIKRLRKKIIALSCGPDPIETIYGMGYKFHSDPERQ